MCGTVNGRRERRGVPLLKGERRVSLEEREKPWEGRETREGGGGGRTEGAKAGLTKQLPCWFQQS